jgi:predicted dehydrogenase
VQSGQIGDLVGVTVIWATLKPDEYFNTTWRIQPGGGPVLINLIHEIDSLRFICGDITEVCAHNSNIRRKHAVEDTSAAILTFANGALGTVLTTDSAATPWNIEMGLGENPRYPMTGQDCSFFMGSSGALSFPGLMHWTYRDPSQRGWENPLVPQPLAIFEHNPFVEQLHHFRDVIEGKEKPLISGVDGARTLAVTLAVLESAETGSAVKVNHLLPV